MYCKSVFELFQRACRRGAEFKVVLIGTQALPVCIQNSV